MDGDAGLTPGAKVSGTKTELRFFSTAVPRDGYPASETSWTEATVELKVECGSTTIVPATTVTGPLPSGGLDGGEEALDGDVEAMPPVLFNAPTVGKRVRIASTEFADGAMIEFKVTGKVTYRRVVGGTVVETSPTVTLVATPTLVAYNKLLLLATDEEWNGSAYVTNPVAPINPLYKTVAAAAMPLVRPLWTSANHTIDPANDAATATWLENGGSLRLDQKLSEATAIFAFTHGEESPLHFRASVGPPNSAAGENGQVYLYQGANSFTSPGSELYKYAYQNRAVGLPDHQLALFYACSLTGGASALRRSLRFDLGNTILDWRGAAGFPRVVSYQLHNSTTTLDQHAKKVMEFLAQGQPLAWALRKAQGSGQGELGMVPKDSTGAAMPMLAPGEYNSSAYPSGCYARLRYVYLEPQRYNSATDAQRNKWFYSYDF